MQSTLVGCFTQVQRSGSRELESGRGVVDMDPARALLWESAPGALVRPWAVERFDPVEAKQLHNLARITVDRGELPSLGVTVKPVDAESLRMPIRGPLHGLAFLVCLGVSG